MNKADFDVANEDGYTLINRADAPEIYVDGISHVLLGYPIIKATFHSVLEIDNSEQSEVRKAVAVLAMDTPTALDIAFYLLEACKSAEPQIMNGANSSIPARLRAFYERIPADIASSGGEDTVKKEPKKPAKSNAKKGT